VGNIRAADRMIWSVIGNMTNLAARLEGLTRDLDASIVLDAVTRRRAGPDALDFVPHPGTLSRGRSEPQDVFALETTEFAAAPADIAFLRSRVGQRRRLLVAWQQICRVACSARRRTRVGVAPCQASLMTDATTTLN
jgi:hypothetical protein